jgi:hypothetical protein
LDSFVCDDEQCRYCIDLEPLNQVRMLLDLDPVHPKRLMVPAPLQHLGEEAFCPPRTTRGGRVDEEQLRPPITNRGLSRSLLWV